MEECNLKKIDHEINALTKMAKRMRKKVLDMALSAGTDSSHFGGGLSIIESTATLYGKTMRIKKNDATYPEYL